MSIPEALLLEGPWDPEVDPEDLSWDEMQTLADRNAVIDTSISTITQDSEAGITTDDTTPL